MEFAICAEFDVLTDLFLDGCREETDTDVQLPSAGKRV